MYLHHNHTIVTTPSHTPPPYDSHHTTSPIHTTSVRLSPHIIFITHHRTHHLRTILTTHHLHYTPPPYDSHHTSSPLRTITHTTSVRFSPHIISITHHIHLITPHLITPHSPHIQCCAHTASFKNGTVNNDRKQRRYRH